MKTKRLSAAVALVVGCGVAMGAVAAPAAADPTTDQINKIIADLMAGSSAPDKGGPAAPQQGPRGSAPNGVTSISVITERYSHGGFGGAGSKLGPDLYALKDGKFTPGIEYNAKTGTGGKNGADNCQIEIQLKGPQTSSVLKTAQCSGYRGTGTVTATGRYTAVVIDRVSGRTGTSSFTIE